jgi:hypothetical protein
MKKANLFMLLFSFILVCCGNSNDYKEGILKFFLEEQQTFKSSVEEILQNQELLDAHFSIKAADGSFSLSPSFFYNNDDNRFTSEYFGSTISLLNSSVQGIKCHPKYILFRKIERGKNLDFTWSEWIVAYNLKSPEILNSLNSKVIYTKVIDDEWKILIVTKSID